MSINQMKNREVFKSKDPDGKEVELVVKRPSTKNSKDAQKIYSKAWREAVEGGAILRVKVQDIIRKQGLWDDEKEQEEDKLQKSLLEGERKLAGGKKFFSNLEEAKKTAIQMRKDRIALGNLRSIIAAVDNNTAESQAESERLNYLVYSCTAFADDERPYYSSYEDYFNRQDEQVNSDAITHFLSLLNNISFDFEKNYPENKFLYKYGFVDDKMRLINAEKKLIDENGKLIDEEGRFVNSEGHLVDIDGNLVDAEGNYLVEFEPFTDEHGNVIPTV